MLNIYTMDIKFLFNAMVKWNITYQILISVLLLRNFKKKMLLAKSSLKVDFISSANPIDITDKASR